ncbi:MAG TPA: hypothetical protein VJH06_02990 [Candidatus Paceibacterota bacterium]
MEKIIHHIIKIRRQPEHIKRHILYALTLFFGIILSLLWIYSLGTTFTNPDTQEEISDELKPFSALKDNLVGGYNTLTAPEEDTSAETQ